ncbi:putative FKBP12-rapamycin binding domain superfamily [Helianthus annuus]|nr:putative FKBP12-rapamycin binding domain superfamily [Helianthus annuus]
MIQVGYTMVGVSEEQLKIYENRLVTCKEDMHMVHHIHKLVDFISDYGRRQGSLDAIYQITKGLLEINQGSLDAFYQITKGTLNSRKVIRCCAMGTCVYHVIHLGASVLYNDFVQSVKVTNDGWLSVKLALEQILVKSRADNYSYKEMLQQLDDLEAAKSVGFSDKFIKMLESMFTLTFDGMHIHNMLFSVHHYSHFMAEKNMLVMVTGILCTMAAYMGNFELLETMKSTNLKSLFLHLFRAFNDKIRKTDDGWFIMKSSSNYELQILDFYDNGILLQELMNKMGRSSCFTKENEEEMVSVIDRLHKNIHKVSCTIQDMSRHSHQYSHDLRKAKKHIKSFSQFSEYRRFISMLSLFN